MTATVTELRELSTYQRRLAQAMRERELQRLVLDLARTLGLLTAHFRPARTAKGWATPVQGDGGGYPDLTIVGSRGVLWMELKAERGRVSEPQQRWIQSLTDAGQLAVVRRPRDWFSGLIRVELEALR